MLALREDQVEAVPGKGDFASRELGRRALGQTHVVPLQDGGHHHERDVTNHLGANACALPGAEGNEVAGLLELTVNDEPLGHELVGFVPQFAVGVDAEDVRQNDGALLNREAYGAEKKR